MNRPYTNTYRKWMWIGVDDRSCRMLKYFYCNLYAGLWMINLIFVKLALRSSVEELNRCFKIRLLWMRPGSYLWLHCRSNHLFHLWLGCERWNLGLRCLLSCRFILLLRVILCMWRGGLGGRSRHLHWRMGHLSIRIYLLSNHLNRNSSISCP